jgi:hypothetical protein
MNNVEAGDVGTGDRALLYCLDTWRHFARFLDVPSNLLLIDLEQLSQRRRAPGILEDVVGDALRIGYLSFAIHLSHEGKKPCKTSSGTSSG